MSQDYYHENSFIVKTITLVRIVVGVALTLAVLFIMVRLIDYSSTPADPSRSRQGLLFPETGDEQQPRTLFETLLNRQAGKSAAPEVRNQSMLDRVPRPEVSTQPGPTAAPAPPQTVRPQPPPAAPEVSVPRVAPPVPAAPVSQPPAPATPAPVDSPLFAVQLGSFHEAERAQALSARLTGLGYPAYVDTRVIADGTTAHRVRVGGFKTRKEAMGMASRIESAEKISGFVTLQ